MIDDPVVTRSAVLLWDQLGGAPTTLAALQIAVEGDALPARFAVGPFAAGVCRALAGAEALRSELHAGPLGATLPSFA